MIKWTFKKNIKNQKINSKEDFMDILIRIEHIKQKEKEKEVVDYDSIDRLIKEWFKCIEDFKIHKVDNQYIFLFSPIALALVKKSFPALFANQVVGVQPMSQPVGLAYAMRFIYNDEDEENDKV